MYSFIICFKIYGRGDQVTASHLLYLWFCLLCFGWRHCIVFVHLDVFKHRFHYAIYQSFLEGNQAPFVIKLAKKRNLNAKECKQAENCSNSDNSTILFKPQQAQ